MLFEEWLSANEKWNNSKLVISIRSNVAFRKRGSRKWFTRMELVAKYQDPEIAEEVIREKESLNKAAPGSCARPHPDAPANEKMRQYLCFDEATEANEEDTILSSMFQCVEREKAKRKSKDKKRKRSSSSSGASSSSRSSSGSESSDSSDKKKKKKKSKKAKKEKAPKGVKPMIFVSAPSTGPVHGPRAHRPTSSGVHVVLPSCSLKTCAKNSCQIDS